MTPSAKTVFVFGIYLLVEGVFLMFAPTSILKQIGLPDPDSPWVIVTGFAVSVLGYYYVRNARENLTSFFRFTVQVRVAQFLFFLGLWWSGSGNLVLVGFSIIELAAGLWTWRVLTTHS